MSYKPQLMPNILAQASAWSGLTALNHLGAILKADRNMKRPERIPIILAKLNWERYIKDTIARTILVTTDGEEGEEMSRTVEDNLHIVRNNIESIENEWKAAPDAKLTTILRRCGVVLDNRKTVEEYMLDTGMIKETEITFVPITHARSIDDQEVVYTPVSDLDIGFLREVVKNDVCKNESYYNCVYNELERREDELIHDD